MNVGARIRAARKEAGLTQAELALRLGLPQSVISDWERGVLQSWVDHSDKLSAALGRPKGHFSLPTIGLTNTQGIPVIGEVEAGTFRIALEIPPEERIILPIVALSGIKGVDQVALKVTGPSMDLLYPDGSYVIVVSADDTDVRDGDRVVVYRAQGELREATIKEVRVEPTGRIGLWPRSSHPEHQQPIYLDPEDQDGPEIAYVVIGQFRQEERPPPPVQWRRARR
jgi:transcriptional regulator with XRE-family HTH domain